MAYPSPITWEMRKKIEYLYNEKNMPIKEIGENLDIPVPSLYREIRRGRDGTANSNMKLAYSAKVADQKVLNRNKPEYRKKKK